MSKTAREERLLSWIHAGRLLVSQPPIIRYSVFVLIVLLCLTTADSFAQVIDSLTSPAPASVYNNGTVDVQEDNFKIFLIIFGSCVVAAAFMTAIAVGCLVAIILAVVIVLAICGITSASLAAGFVRRSWTSGLKTFLCLSTITISTAGGIPVAWMISILTQRPLSIAATVVIGLTGGMIGGVFLYWLLVILGREARYYFNRLMA
ncbi:hypothetical protein [Chitinophaga agri]|uniref:Uncharacterized protein n=1 Tax=Chitinophaga agri TaxID=2703787 RepID=A0A6B9Z8V0_9BACT|nr:hypothetical protein [Chitinophaga agri]QHS58672.1 hypothetical protein GWR21_03370 [Chitinophaga agri]